MKSATINSTTGFADKDATDPESATGLSDQALLRAQDLYCERDERVLFSRLNFSLFGGDLLQVQGSNGSGKTTLLRILCGLNDSYEGDIYWQGEPISEIREGFLASLLYIGHRAAVNKILSARENLRWRCALHTPVTDVEIETALASVGLMGYEDAPCHHLSAGQQQRVALASLQLNPARLWVLDEPFTTLDVKGVRALEILLTSHVNNGGAVLLTTHHKLEVDCTVRVLNLDELEKQ